MSAIHFRQPIPIRLLHCAIALWAATGQAALPPDPANAALLYYRAMILRPQPDASTHTSMIGVLRGDNPNGQVRAYMRTSEDVVRLTDAGTRIPRCDWGVMYSRGDNWPGTTLPELRELSTILDVDARILAADGNYAGALERALSIRRFANHIASEEIVSYLVSLSVHGLSFECIQHILGSVTVDSEVLIWLQAQLSAVQGPPPSLGASLELTLDQALDAGAIARWRERLTDSPAWDILLPLTEEETVE